MDFEPRDRDYFMFAAQQNLFVTLCEGDPTTLECGDSELGERILGNSHHIIEHYWNPRIGSDLDVIAMPTIT